MKKIILLLLLFTIQTFPQWEFGYKNTGSGGSGSSRFSAVDLDGSSEYMYRNYAAADSFLNLNGYERTVLPQSTMKVANVLKDSVRTFTANNDTNKWIAYALPVVPTIVGGKYRITTSGADEGIRSSYSLDNGTLIYVKFKARIVSGGTSYAMYIGRNLAGGAVVCTLSTEEKTYELTSLVATTTGAFYLMSQQAGAYVVEYDDIEVREVTNSVTNGTMDSTGAWAGTDWAVGSGVVTATASSSALTKNNVAGVVGRRYILTWQIPTFTSGTSVTASFGGASGTARTVAGVYSDTLTATSTGLLTFTPVNFTGTIGNVHLYEIPSYRGVGNHSVGWSKVDALPNSSSDTTSLRIISTGAGSASANYAYIVSGANTYHSMTSGNKYTLEMWARSEVTGCSLSVHAQGQTKTVAIGNTPGTFTKLVFNFEANSTVADSIRIFVNQADTLFLDSLRIRQRYDASFSAWIYPKTVSGEYSIISRTNGSLSTPYWQFGQSTDSLVLKFYDNAGRTIQAKKGGLVANRWQMASFIWTGDSAHVYLDGVGATTALNDTVGITDYTNDTLRVGSTAKTRLYNGYIGEILMHRYNNIFGSTFTVSTPLTQFGAYTRGATFSNTYSGGDIKTMLNFDWSVYDTVPNFLADLSGNQYNLSQNGIEVTNHIYWKR